MAIVNFSVFLNSYSDPRASNNPNLSNFKWMREINGINTTAATSMSAQIAASQSKTFFTNDPKQMIYIEADQPCDITINGVLAPSLVPVTINGVTLPGVFLINSIVNTLQVTNNGTAIANVFVAAVA